MARLVGSMGTVALFERLLTALLREQGIEPSSQKRSGNGNGEFPSATSFCKLRFETGAWWINFGYDERTKKGIGQITFPYHNLETFVKTLENGSFYTPELKSREGEDLVAKLENGSDHGR